MSATSTSATPREVAPGLVSVVIPTRNRADLLPETLASIHAQTHRPVEVIVVDDGSTDDTAEVVAQARETMTRSRKALFAVSYLRQSPRGAPAARNAGLRLARGAYVQFLDSDDLVCATKFSRCIREIQTRGVAVVVMDAERFTETGDRQHIPFASRTPRTLSTHALSGLTNGQSCLFTRSAVDRLGPWREDLQIWQDFEYTARIFAMGLPVAWIPSLGNRIRNTPGSLMDQPDSEVYDSRIRACAYVEELARSHGAFTPELEAAIGRRLSTVARRLHGEGAADAAAVVRKEALRRLPPPERVRHQLHLSLTALVSSLGRAGRRRHP